ncbi:GNAT family N-acetyltransferase [Ruminococcus sp.]|uniref:GNAT family N-acetyltransferase n=1 Tax=Ruminococcus sp. TaxID=41978 RepID=UPI0025DE0D56|nr:GNAT family N-acetyltransferase [Ruminococcus sp.]MBQ6252635.1 GNAT family N-acetyltransferase [Ruminococcus sp.]
MKEIPTKEYRSYIAEAQSIAFCTVYPTAVAEGIQSGQIYKGSSCTVFRCHNGFTFVSGVPDSKDTAELHRLIINEGAKLLTDDDSLCKALSAMGGVTLFPRYNYSFRHDKAPVAELPDGYTLRSIDAELFDRLTGTVVPSMFWSDCKEFSANGKGICIMHGAEPASWAFTSAVSSTEADIGIETAEAHRHRGLAYAAAGAVIREVLPQRRPVWGCHQSNKGSAHTAEKLGFVRALPCTLIRKSG